MSLQPTILSRHKLTRSVATGATVIVLATGGYAVADSGSTTSSTANAATTGKVVPFQRGQPSPATKVGQIPAGKVVGAE
jgi:hypothetical protein